GVGNDIVAGNVGNDTVCGGDGNEQLYGNVGTDIMDGCEGDDTLFGGQDNDILIGGNGDDWLFGDLGNDTLTGGVGSERFIFSATTGSNTITDFEDGIDLLGLTGGLTFAELTVAQGATGTLISITSSGELLASLNGVSATLITADDFTLV
ncbi:MAG: calcium-binding protein, partial [Oscillatoriaceae bacterium SKYG93]|nr:calcium-binding protein [Oscillatoriaceae bacterium SKYG93]MDW8453685.1 calcium-binding protein [Oscillatoriaceae cyanobacterium SKYGB_i_bin93]